MNTGGIKKGSDKFQFTLLRQFFGTVFPSAAAVPLFHSHLLLPSDVSVLSGGTCPEKKIQFSPFCSGKVADEAMFFFCLCFLIFRGHWYFNRDPNFKSKG